jgi:hypothetical protein
MIPENEPESGWSDKIYASRRPLLGVEEFTAAAREKMLPGPFPDLGLDPVQAAGGEPFALPVAYMGWF